MRAFDPGNSQAACRLQVQPRARIAAKAARKPYGGIGIGVSPRRINEIVPRKRSITADTALRLGKFFAMEVPFWMNLQSHYDLEVAKDAIAGKLDREVEVLKAA